MPPRPALPADDLYGRLDVPVDASPEAIELAWRALLRRHHPDVAGDDGLEIAKRVNVAHDWLSDPVLRARYDRERGLRHAVGPRGDAHGRSLAGSRRRRRVRSRRACRSGTAAATGRPGDARRPVHRPGRRAHTTELDRLALVDPPPIAFGATIRRFLPPDRLEALELIDARIAAALPPGADRPPIRDTIESYATELVLGTFLDDLLSEPFRSRTQERLVRGWEAAVGQPRYGPNGTAVEQLLGRIAALDPAGVRHLAATGAGLAGSEPPWPPSISLEDEDGLRISAQLAARDAAAAVPGGVDAATRSRARSAAGRPAHLLALRHAFTVHVFDELAAPWRPWLIAAKAPPPVRDSVRRSGGRSAR